MNKKKLNINLVQHLWFDQVLSLSNGYPCEPCDQQCIVNQQIVP
jgi:hypothetical protein